MWQHCVGDNGVGFGPRVVDIWEGALKTEQTASVRALRQECMCTQEC